MPYKSDTNKLRGNIENMRASEIDLRMKSENEITPLFKEVFFNLDSSGTFIRLNNPWTLLSGYDLQHSLHQSIFTYLEDQEQIKQIKEFIFGNARQSLTIELKIKTLNSLKWVSTSLLKTDKYTPNGMIWGTFTDITKWKEEQDVLLKHLSQVKNQQTRNIDLFKNFLHDINSAHAGILSSIELLELINSETDAKGKHESKHYSEIKSQILMISNLLDNFVSSLQLKSY
ncbi:hypothetical protein [Pedobacter sp. KLB.chiD]|uniref:hypothetical protein n=1 Tax=Pedobacter sp. KLB.chiD TaxID=3387402 RepID=UPI00399BB03C